MKEMKNGFYFRYLTALLSEDSNVIIYDDDWFPYNKFSHSNWILLFKKNKKNKIVSHHIGSIDGMKWCATPLIIYRKWLYLMWYDKLYDENTAEDGHLSFTLLLLCNIKCTRIAIKDLYYENDKSNKQHNSSFQWKTYISYIKNRINSTSISNIKNVFQIN